MPTSVLLAVLAAAGLLALAPALVRRYDATERLVAERALSTARVLARAGSPRPHRKRTVPGTRPVNPPRTVVHRVSDGEPVEAPVPRPVSGLPLGGRSGGGPGRRRQARQPRAVYRRRRVLLALVVFNIVELVGVVCVGPGFWISMAFSGTLLGAYLVHLRNRALTERRRRRAEARYTAWVAARQAAVRREQARRVAAKREALEQELIERDRMRREAARIASVRGRPYSSRAAGQ
ncbi:MAG: hypothetical protein KJO75_21945 [Dactylosporangium sp.]|nr:hypothetical protein [Dactylosporangium sp.]